MRLSSADEAELKWFFEGPDGSLGLKSSGGAFENYMKVGTRIQMGAPDELDADKAIAVLQRVKRIEAIFGRMPRAAVRTIKRWVTTSAERIERDHPGITKAIGQDVRALAREQIDAAYQAVRDGDRDSILTLRTKAAETISLAVREWRSAMPRRRVKP